MSETTIEVQKRDIAGKSAARQLRRADLVPAVLYGGGRESVSIQVPKKQLLELFKSGGHENRIFLLKLAGTDKDRHAMIRDLQLDPMTNQIVHVDFQRILMTERVRVKVHLVLDGTPYGVRTEGGVLDFVNREVEIECLPATIPQEIHADVTELRVGQHLEAGALTLPQDVELTSDADMVIVSVKHARAEVVEAVAPAAVAEPEVVARGKKEEAKES